MLESYSDIRSLISAEPLWFDDNGVPRYAFFSPRLVPNIYAHYAVLYKIACQSCGRRFMVSDCWESHRLERYGRRVHVEIVPPPTRESLSSLHYGDPPRHDCTGDTMNCDDIRIVEFWRRNADHEWERVPELEIALSDEGEAVR